MQLHLKSKEMAWGGIMMALAVILIVLSGIVEQSSAFLLATASFITGVFQRRFSPRAGAVFIVGTFLVGFFLAPQKLYCFTFVGFSVYVSVAEYLRNKQISAVSKTLLKGVCYHILLIIALITINYFVGFDLLLSDEWIKKLYKIPILFAIVTVAATEILWITFDKAYIFFQGKYGKILMREEEI